MYGQKPADSRLTSFSVLFAAYKGDAVALKQGAESIARLTDRSHVLIAEACAHVGEGLQVSFVNGRDFPEDLSPYDLVIHCGACMFNRRYVLDRIRSSQSQGVPITNYGMAIAYLTGILHKIDFAG